MKLHRIHAAPSAGVGGRSFDLLGRWRCDGAQDPAITRLVAHRLSLCWNLCEGWPTEDLEGGILRDIEETTLHLLDELFVADFEVELPQAVIDLRGKLKALFEKGQKVYDNTDGRPADCDGCYPPKEKK